VGLDAKKMTIAVEPRQIFAILSPTTANDTAVPATRSGCDSTAIDSNENKQYLAVDNKLEPTVERHRDTTTY